MSQSTLLWQCLVLEEQIFLDHITSLTLKFDYIITLVSTEDMGIAQWLGSQWRTSTTRVQILSGTNF
jgi:hypothetical protein